ncbi:hypothetical protein CPR19088_GLDEOEPO_01823 [Companilactobacillus paralimentarius]
MGTGSSHRAVSNLDFELRKVREVQNSSRGVMAKAITPPTQRPKFLLFPASSLLMNGNFLVLP